MPQPRVVLTNIQTGALVADLKPTNFNAMRRVNHTGSWGFTIPMIVPRASQLENYCWMQLYLGSNILIEGEVDKVKRAMSADKSGYNVSGLGEAEELARSMSKDSSHYQDVPVLLILYDLLGYAPGWDVGNTATMLDSNVRTTIDLRNDENLLSQIQQTCKAAPGLFWRYGGLNAAGDRVLDFGYFDEQENVHHAQHGFQCRLANRAGFSQLQSMGFVENRSNLVYQVAGYGGNYDDGAGNDELITLDDAVAAGVVVDPDFPIVTAANGQTVVQNNNLAPVGGTVRVKFDIHITENGDPPTATEVDEAAEGLYWRCVRYLQEHGHADEEYTAKTIYIARRPEVGNRIWIDAHTVTGLDCDTGGRRIIPGFNFNGSLRVGEWRIRGTGDTISVDYKLTENEYITFGDDADIQMYDMLKSRIPNTTQFGSLMRSVRTSAKTTDTAVPAGQPPDCNLVAGDPLTPAGLTVTVPLPPVGSWVNTISVMDIQIFPADTYRWRIVTAPALPATPLVLCITRLDGGNWTIVDTCTVQVTWLRSE